MSSEPEERRWRLVQILAHVGYADWNLFYEFLSTENRREINPNVLNFDLHKLLSEKKIQRKGDGFVLPPWKLDNEGRIIFQNEYADSV